MTPDPSANSSSSSSIHRQIGIGFLLVFLFLFFEAKSLAQSPVPASTMTCGSSPAVNGGPFKSIDPHNGAHLPSHGAIRGMVVFVQTLNDKNPDPNWPLGSMPHWANNYVQRLERYYSDMSNGSMQLQLDLLPNLMITRSTEDSYVYWLQNFGDAIKEVIDSLDTSTDFSLYDQWDSEGKAYRVEKGPDGQVELLIFVFRSIANSNFMPFTGVSDLGFAGYQFLDGTLERWAYGGSGQFNDASASGLTICKSPGHSLVIDQEFAFQVTIHEFGHKLFGEGHPAEIFAGLGVMANGGNGYAMNSFERHLTGYIQFKETTPGTDTVVTLKDYVTTGDALLIPIPAAPRTYYTLEYRSRISEWDTAPARGLYAYRIYDSWGKNQKEVHLVSAEGKYEWAVDSATNKIHPWKPSAIAGYHRFERIPIEGKSYWADGWWGDPRCAFTLDRPEIAPLKNPTTDFIFGSDTVITNLHITLIAADSASATVRISYNDPAILSASVPENPKLSLYTPYPHPLKEHSEGLIPFSVEHSGPVQIILYDALGRLVRTLLSSEVSAGRNQFRFSTEGLSAGMYQIVLESAAGLTAQTIVIAR